MIYPYSTPLGDYTLTLDSDDKSLRPWDAADEYLLSSYQDLHSIEDSSVMIVNDSHGALTLPLTEKCALLVQDSLRAIRETRSNITGSGLTAPAATSLLGLQDIHTIRHILMKIPKSIDYFRFQLDFIARRLTVPCSISAGGMNKYLPRAFFDVFNEYCGEASWSRIVKKARIYSGTLTPRPSPGLPVRNEVSPPERSFPYRDNRFFSYPGTFSHGRLDSGSRFLLDYLFSSEGESRVLSALTPGARIADPGCGCGVLGLTVLTLRPGIKAFLSDDNAMAVRGSLYNSGKLGLLESCQIVQDNIMETVPPSTMDFVICNPPFHRGHTVSVETGFAFIRESARVLKKGGRALFVVNGTLGYGTILKDNFNSISVIRENRKYKLILCTL
ncbi:MAG: methyltransferase [Spirochaetales bacterium]|nr:methyltransferase [Spirochaetales bacterium]